MAASSLIQVKRCRNAGSAVFTTSGVSDFTSGWAPLNRMNYDQFLRG